MEIVFAALEARGWPWYLTGSEALAAYGAPRQTLDTDVVVDAAPTQLAELAVALSDRFLFAEPIHAGGRWMASMIDRITIGKVDLIIRDPDAWGAAAMARRTPWGHPIWGPVWVSTLEDLILAKLEWSEGISELQLRDCTILWRMNRTTIDTAYLGRWASMLGLTHRLEAVQDAA
jgi:hypothetical protein